MMIWNLEWIEGKKRVVNAKRMVFIGEGWLIRNGQAEALFFELTD
jgi:hypothetical protein